MFPLAETWECSAHPDGPSVVDSGRFKGKTLDRLLTMHPEFLGTKVEAGKGLPILVKLIDANKDLSVQVHPSDEYAYIHENQNGKTEMWYVLDAKQNASLICGFLHDVTKEQLLDAVETGKLFKHLKKIFVQKGDVFYIPAGTIHAIGAGIMLAEIQESSNVTYRVFDYNRIDKNGRKRELHFDKAIDVLNMKAGIDVRQKPRKINYYPGCSKEVLCRCQYFETEKIQVSTKISFTVLDSSFQVVLCIDGKGVITTRHTEYQLEFKKGDCIFIPAGVGSCIIRGCAELLKIRC